MFDLYLYSKNLLFCLVRSACFHTLSGAMRRLSYSDCGHIEGCMAISVCDI